MMLRMLRELSPMLLAAAMCACAPPPYATPKDTGATDTGGANDSLDSAHTGETGHTGDTGHTGEQAPPDPTIRFIFPESSTTDRYCSTFMVAVDIDNFEMDSEHFGGDDVEGEGHWHLYSDGAYIGAGSGQYLFIPDSKALTEGEHQLEARLSENDHDEFDPRIYDTVEIFVDDTPDDPETPEVETCLGATGSAPEGGGAGDTGTGGSGY